MLASRRRTAGLIRVRLEDWTIEGDVLRIRDKMWRFDFDDANRAERVFRDLKNGTLEEVSLRLGARPALDPHMKREASARM